MSSSSKNNDFNPQIATMENDSQLLQQQGQEQEYMKPQRRSAIVMKPSESLSRSERQQLLKLEILADLEDEANLQNNSTITEDGDDNDTTSDRRVRFGTAAYHEHPTIVGDHPDCFHGYPLSIDWKAVRSTVVDIPDEEEECEDWGEEMKRQNSEDTSSTASGRSDLRLSASDRYDRLREAGISRAEIMEGQKAVNIAKRQRRRTQEQMKNEHWHLKLESAKRTWKSLSAKLPFSPQKQEETPSMTMTSASSLPERNNDSERTTNSSQSVESILKKEGSSKTGPNENTSIKSADKTTATKFPTHRRRNAVIITFDLGSFSSSFSLSAELSPNDEDATAPTMVDVEEDDDNHSFHGEL